MAKGGTASGGMAASGYSTSTAGYGNTGANSDGSSFGGATNSATGQSMSASTAGSSGSGKGGGSSNPNQGGAFQDGYTISADPATGKYSIATDANGKHSIQSAAKKSEQNNNNSTAETVSVDNMDAKAANKAKGLLTISERKTNIKGVDEEGKTLSGRAGDRNGDGKISFGEAIANHFSNLAARVNSFFGGADSNGLTAAGRQADKNGDGKVSFGERIGNMFNNLGTNVNQAFGGVNYQGRTKAGEQVVNPGEHVSFGQRMSNIGHNIASKNGAYWSDANNNGIMDSNEVAGAAAQRAAFGMMGMIPGVGILASNTLSGLTSGAQGGKGNSLSAQLGRSLAEAGKNSKSKGKTNSNTNTITGSGTTPTIVPEVGSVQVAKAPEEITAKNFMKKVKQLKLNTPAVSSAYVSRKQDEHRDIAISDEELKKFAIRSLNNNKYNPYWV